MRLLLVLLFSIWTFSALAIPCDCEVMVYSPMTGPHGLPPNKLKTYQLEEFSTYSVKNQLECREVCLERFQEDMSTSRLREQLRSYSGRLIENGVLGYNCTGLTTFHYPVRVKAVLGNRGLGNVSNFIEVVNYEQTCF